MTAPRSVGFTSLLPFLDGDRQRSPLTALSCTTPNEFAVARSTRSPFYWSRPDTTVGLTSCNGVAIGNAGRIGDDMPLSQSDQEWLAGIRRVAAMIESGEVDAPDSIRESIADSD